MYGLNCSTMILKWIHQRLASVLPTLNACITGEIDQTACTLYSNLSNLNEISSTSFQVLDTVLTNLSSSSTWHHSRSCLNATRPLTRFKFDIVDVVVFRFFFTLEATYGKI